MVSTRWDPFVEMSRLRNEMDRLFGRYGLGLMSPFGSAPQLGVGGYPPVNIWEDENNLYVEAELPGFELDDLEIYVTGGNQLSIKGERKQPELKGGAWHRQERGYGAFHRTIDLSCDVGSDQVSAEFKHGVLTVTLPKSEEAKPRRIAVKAE